MKVREEGQTMIAVGVIMDTAIDLKETMDMEIGKGTIGMETEVEAGVEEAAEEDMSTMTIPVLALLPPTQSQTSSTKMKSKSQR